MSDQVHRREVRLQATFAELREVGVRREAEHPFDDLRQDPLRQQLLVVLPGAVGEVFAKVGGIRELPIEARTAIEHLA